MKCTDQEKAKLIGSYELGLLSREEKERFEAHLLECDACFQDLYELSPAVAMLREEGMVPSGEMGLSDETEVPRGDGGSFPWARRRWVYVVSGVAAAGLACVLAIWALFPGEEPSRLRGPEQGSVLVYAPKGEVPRPVEIDWAPVPAARSYEVRIHTSGGRLVWREQVDGPPAGLPDGVRESLDPRETYFWQVEAIAEDGTRWKSRLVRFTVRR